MVIFVSLLIQELKCEFENGICLAFVRFTHSQVDKNNDHQNGLLFCMRMAVVQRL